MHSSILSIAARYLFPLLVVLSLVVLYRGHNYPGGGFIGGLIAASAFLLLALSRGWDAAVQALRVEPLTLLVVGLAVALASGLPGLFGAQPIMTGHWLPFFELPLLGKVKLGTPLLFDVGVFLTVVGFTIKCAHSLATQKEI